MAEASPSKGHRLTQQEAEILGHSSVLLVHDEIDDLAGFPLLQGERDYLDEIARLETSRKRYLAQTKALTAQNDLLKSARDQIPSKPVSTARSFSRKALGEAQYTKSLNKEILSSLHNRLDTATSTIKSHSKTAPPLIAERLKVHDQTISGFSIPSPNPSTTASAPDPDLSRTEHLTNALISLRSTALRDRLDRIFLEALQQPPSASEPPPTTELTALEADIASLYVEIDDVLSMLVSQQHLQPLISAREQIKAAGSRLSNSLLASAVLKLQSLTSELSSLEEYIKATRSSQLFLQHLDKHLRQIDIAVHDTLSASDVVSSITCISKAEILTKRFLEHVGGPRKQAADSVGDPTSQEDLSDVLSTLTGATRTRAAAVKALISVTDSSSDTSAKLHELEIRIEERRQALSKQSS